LLISRSSDGPGNRLFTRSAKAWTESSTARSRTHASSRVVGGRFTGPLNFLYISRPLQIPADAVGTQNARRSAQDYAGGRVFESLIAFGLADQVTEENCRNRLLERGKGELSPEI
jgi:hypothetical protein